MKSEVGTFCRFFIDVDGATENMDDPSKTERRRRFFLGTLFKLLQQVVVQLNKG
jgi:hypothetical protein